VSFRYLSLRTLSSAAVPLFRRGHGGALRERVTHAASRSSSRARYGRLPASRRARDGTAPIRRNDHAIATGSVSGADEKGGGTGGREGRQAFPGFSTGRRRRRRRRRRHRRAGGCARSFLMSNLSSLPSRAYASLGALKRANLATRSGLAVAWDARSRLEGRRGFFSAP